MKTLYTILLILICYTAFAQKSDSTHMHYRITRGIISHQTVLKSKPNIKNGLCEMISGRKVIASGLYKNDQRYCRWRFFNTTDSLEQIYNYTTNKVEYNLANENFKYITDSLKAGDKVIYPAKIGGFTYAMYYLLDRFKIPSVIKQQPGVYKLYYIFSLDEAGSLVKYETNIVSDDYNKLETVNLSKLREEDFKFSPAIFNEKSIPSTLIYESKITVN